MRLMRNVLQYFTQRDQERSTVAGVSFFETADFAVEYKQYNWWINGAANKWKPSYQQQQFHEFHDGESVGGRLGN
jgi:hypothetical protein